jgi:hypothetical protein
MNFVFGFLFGSIAVSLFICANRLGDIARLLRVIHRENVMLRDYLTEKLK